MSDTGLGLAGRRGFARCPKCNELIDASVDVCRFCGSSLDRAAIQKSAALQASITEAKAKANNRRALVAAAISLLGTILLYAAWYGLKLVIPIQGDNKP